MNFLKNWVKIQFFSFIFVGMLIIERKMGVGVLFCGDWER